MKTGDSNIIYKGTTIAVISKPCIAINLKNIFYFYDKMLITNMFFPTVFFGKYYIKPINKVFF